MEPIVAEYAEQHVQLDLNEAIATMSDVNNLPMALQTMKKLLEKGFEFEISKTPLQLIEMFSVRITNEMPLYSQEKSNNKKIKIYKLINHVKSDNDTRMVRFYSNIEL